MAIYVRPDGPSSSRRRVLTAGIQEYGAYERRRCVRTRHGEDDGLSSSRGCVLTQEDGAYERGQTVRTRHGEDDGERSPVFSTAPKGDGSVLTRPDGMPTRGRQRPDGTPTRGRERPDTS